MQGFYIFLAIAGVICVVLSFFLSEKLDGKMQSTELDISEEMLQVFMKQNENLIHNSLDGSIEKVKEEVLEETTQELNRLTNEKIMAVDEFSDTVLEKINQNHSEVIFLYNMLNEKEKELKELVSSMNQVANRKTASTKNTPVKSEKGNKGAGKKTQVLADEKKEIKKESVSEPKLKLTEPEKKKEAHTREEILDMYESGLSITDIAQKLKMGKGEIKLIIDLYQGAKQ